MPQTCPQCQSQVADDAGTCPSCGSSLSASPTSTATQAAPTVSAPAPAAAAGAAASSGSSIPAYKFDAARWSLADRIAGVATVVLFISLFLAWFGITVIGITVTASGVSAHGYLYIVMVICILEIAYLVLRAGWDELPDQREPSAPHRDDGGDHRQPGARLHRLHFQAWRIGRRLAVRCIPRADRGDRRCSPLCDSAAARKDDELIAGRTTARRAERPPLVSAAWPRGAGPGSSPPTDRPRRRRNGA